MMYIHTRLDVFAIIIRCGVVDVNGTFPKQFLASGSSSWIIPES